MLVSRAPGLPAAYHIYFCSRPKRTGTLKKSVYILTGLLRDIYRPWKELGMKRTRNSARFDPYYKIQYHDVISMVWRDVQKTFATPQSAQEDFLPGKRCRIMKITMDGRTPLLEVG